MISPLDEAKEMPELKNPYYDRFEACDGRRWIGLESLASRTRSSILRGWRMRDRYISMFGFAVPSQAAVRRIAKLGPIVEIGAGSGYWAWMLKQAGADIIAYDIAPKQPVGIRSRWRIRWFDVQAQPHQVVLKHPDRVLLLVWPSYNDGWAADCLRLYGGDTVVYAGEGEYGCCADEQFFRELAAKWQLVEELPIPQWEGIHDYVTIYRRES